MTLPVVLFTLLSCLTAIVSPWLGVVFYYILAVGQIKSLFPHDFGNSRSSLYITLATLVGLVLATATRQVDWRRLVQWPNLLMMLMLACVNLSHAFSNFEEYDHILRLPLTSSEIVVVINKIMLMFFMATLLIDTRFKLIFLITTIAAIFFYYTLWANEIYFTGELWRFGDNGRLNGPWGAYYDENYFAMLFVLLTPILYYLSIGTSNRWIRYGLWLAIPLSWHALFLTSSRGGLFSLSIVCIYIFFRSYSKKASVVLVVALVVAVVDQGGNMLDRINSTVSAEEEERARAYIENTDDSPEIGDKAIDPRVISWQVGLQIMRDYPLLGVGSGNFMKAFPEYHDSRPHVAHNTFVQIGASAGIASALIYLYFLWMRLKNVFSKPDPTKKYANGHKRDYLDDLVNGMFVGFYCIALFLDLQVLEILYFILLIGFCKYSLESKKEKARFGLIESIYRWKQDQESDAMQEVQDRDPTGSDVLVPQGPLVAGAMAAESATASVLEAESGVTTAPARGTQRAGNTIGSAAAYAANQYARKAS